MIAAEFEFRRRSLINLIHFWLAFQLYSLDRVNVVAALIRGSAHEEVLARVIFGFGALLLGIAAAIRTWAAAYLRSDVVHDPALHAEKLVVDGPYRYLRNPLYLGTFLLSIGLGLLASRSGFLLLAIGAAIRIPRLIGREESQLEKQQGERFREFCRCVPKLIPSLRPRIASAGLRPRWGQAFRGEAFMWGFFVAMAAFTITLRPQVAEILAGAAVVLWLFPRRIWRGRKPEAA
jgi:protein-S-isoprenylcysteine O-methyltransferase Ste14